MTAQLLASELANLIQESKRKHNDLRQVRSAMRTVLSRPATSPRHTPALRAPHCVFRLADNIGRQLKSLSMS